MYIACGFGNLLLRLAFGRKLTLKLLSASMAFDASMVRCEFD
jgi:hypothetical protein